MGDFSDLAATAHSRPLPERRVRFRSSRTATHPSGQHRVQVATCRLRQDASSLRRPPTMLIVLPHKLRPQATSVASFWFAAVKLLRDSRQLAPPCGIDKSQVQRQRKSRLGAEDRPADRVQQRRVHQAFTGPDRIARHSQIRRHSRPRWPKPAWLPARSECASGPSSRHAAGTMLLRRLVEVHRSPLP